MGTRDRRVDAYIEKSAEFARPILKHLRDTVHAACPDVEETMKWSLPHFMYKGMMCGMAAFKEHAAFNFWKGDLVVDDASKRDEAMGHLGRLTKISDLPPKRVLTAYIKRAAALNDDGVKMPRAPRQPARPVRVPADFAAALRKSSKAKAAFDGFPPSHKRDYVEWITEAKRADTRARRIAQSLAQIVDGKSRNWKYER
jgi:uncharacterized protein YdeI (YjbR/CyaY-like superfamily)